MVKRWLFDVIYDLQIIFLIFWIGHVCGKCVQILFHIVYYDDYQLHYATWQFDNEVLQP